MATVTAEVIVKGALRKAGNTFPSAQNKADALIDLNAMLGIWGAPGLLVPVLTTESFSLVQGTISYTIGSSGDFDTVRPVKIRIAYLQDSNGFDYPIETDMDKPQYNANIDKTAQSRPCRLLYVQSYPLGKIYFDWAPDEAYTLFIDTLKPLTEFPTLGTTVDLPDEYKLALIYNLALLVADDLGVVLSNTVISMAGMTKRIIRRNNFRVQATEIDGALRRGRTFNILTGQSNP